MYLICKRFFGEIQGGLDLRRTSGLGMSADPNMRAWNVIFGVSTGSWTVSPGGSGMKNYLNIRAASRAMNKMMACNWNSLLRMWRQIPRLRNSAVNRQACLQRTVQVVSKASGACFQRSSSLAAFPAQAVHGYHLLLYRRAFTAWTKRMYCRNKAVRRSHSV